jgi:hypothetical protein
LMILLVHVLTASADTKVFLMAGQSHMVGLGGYSGYIPLNTYPWTSYPYGQGADAPCPAPYNQPLSAVKFWNYNPDAVGSDLVHHPGLGNGWVNLQPGYGNRTDEFGPEASFGARLHELFPSDEIYLIKYAVGGTNLAYSWNPSQQNDQNTCYTVFKSRVDAALANLTAAGKNPTIAGMAWMQGEDDSTIISYGQWYQLNLMNLVSKARSDFDAPEMRFVTGRVTYMGALWGSVYSCDLVRVAQSSISTYVSNASWVDTDDLEWAYYGHYGTSGQINLGLRFANAFAVPEPSTLVLAGMGLLGLIGHAWRRRKSPLPLGED